MIQVNVTRILLNENNRIAHEYFQIGSFARWSKLKETKQAEKLEQKALEYNYEKMYEQGLVTI